MPHSTDAQDIFEWRNDISSRKMFFNSHNVSFDEHLVWFAKELKSDDCVLLIGLIGDKNWGCVVSALMLKKIQQKYL